MYIGFVDAGFEISLATDIWNDAVSTYSTNHPTITTMAGDAFDLAEKIVSKGRGASLVFGGPPCQDFSVAGLRKGDGIRADQTDVFARIAVKINPKWIVMENVNTITTIGKRHLDNVLKCLKRNGYGFTQTVLNAADYGAPQKRRRFFLIACKNRVNNDSRLISVLDSLKTASKSVSECLPDTNTEYYYRHPRSYTRRAIFSIDEQSPTIRGVNRPIPPNYQPHPKDAARDLSQVRMLTAQERAVIQTFPVKYKFVGSKTSVEQQIGNAVPPVLAMAVGTAIYSIDAIE